ncbi:MAG TPA: tetratricopeptide repeat protein [Clostridia bacterium]|nr:tetratricopeptide repeat protein [Clostridia bacterium]
MQADQKHIEVISQLINTYYQAILINPELKSQSFVERFSEFYYDCDNITGTYKQLMLNAKDVFYEYSIIKFLFYYAVYKNSIEKLKNYIVPWLGIYIITGAYNDCIYCAGSCLTSDHWAMLSPQTQMKILQLKAKSERNIGMFEEAFKSYRMALQIANDNCDKMERGIILLKIGKVYSNYLLQKSLAIGFLQEAFDTLTESGNGDLETQKYISICHDALGQVKRSRSLDEAKFHFENAIAINNRIGRVDGNSRANAHLLTIEFYRSSDLSTRMDLIDKMQDIIAELLDDDKNEVGTGVRWVQLSDMYLEVGDLKKASECLEAAKEIAERYSDNKTLVRVYLSEGKLYKYDPEKAITALKKGRMMSEKFKLMLFESQINSAEIELFNYLTKTGIFNIKTESPVNLLERNKVIYLDLVNRVKSSLSRVNNRDSMKDEFSNLSYISASKLKEHILLDYDEIIAQLDGIIKNLMLELNRVESKKQELLVLSVTNSIARELLHDMKGLIPLNSGYSQLNRVCEALRKIRVRLSSDEPLDEQHVNDFDEQIAKLENIDLNLCKIKQLISRNISLPRDLMENVSLSNVSDRVINEIKQIMTNYSDKLLFLRKCNDIYVTLNTEMVMNTIKNLVRNAIEYIEGKQNPACQFQICIILDSEYIGDRTIGNMSRNGVIKVLTTFDDRGIADEAYELISKGLKEGRSNNTYSSGYGLEHVKMVFCQLIKGSVESCFSADENKYSAGIKITLPVGMNPDIDQFETEAVSG